MRIKIPAMSAMSGEIRATVITVSCGTGRPPLMARDAASAACAPAADSGVPSSEGTFGRRHAPRRNDLYPGRIETYDAGFW